MAVLGTLEYMIRVNTSELKSGITSSESQVKGYGNRLSTWAVAKGQMISRLAERAVSSVARFTKGSVVEAMSFDKAMSQVAATMGTTVDQIENLEQFARKMGSETAYSATEAAQALNYMALAGYDADTSMRMLPNVLNLAAAGNFDLASASDMVTDAQSALGLTLAETETMVDQMAVTSSKTNTSVEQLGQAFLTVGGTAKDLKGGTQELAAVLGVLADNGVKGAEGGTALRNMLQSLQGKSSVAAKELKKLGINAYDTAGNLRSLPEIFADFNEVFSTSTMQERNSAFRKIFNARDLKSVNALLGTTTDRWQEIYTAIGNSDGAAKRMAETQLDNLAGDITKFNSALGEAKIAISDVLEPALRKFVQNGTAIVQNLTEAFKEGGLSGAIAEAKRMLNNFITELQSSDNSRLQAIGDGLETIKKVFKWIIDNKDLVIVAIKGIVGAWAGLKIANGVLNLGNLVTGLKGMGGRLVNGLFGWGSASGAGTPTANAGTPTGTSAGTPTVNSSQAGLFFRKLGVGATNLVQQFSTRGLGFPMLQDWFMNNTLPGQTLRNTGDIGTTLKVSGEAIAKYFTQDLPKNFQDYIKGSYWTQITEGVTGYFESVKKSWSDFMTYWEGQNSASEQAKVYKQALDELQNFFSGEEPIKVPIEPEVPDDAAEDIAAQIGTVKVGTRMVPISFTGGGGGGGGGKFSVLQFHAKGARTIPFDDYPALLHRNEMVLTASQARQYREGSGGGVDYATLGTMIGEAIETAIGRVGVYMSGDRVADLTTRRLQGNINANNNARLRAMGG